MQISTPIIVVVTGEGGSGGALGIAVGNRVLMLEYSIYSVISPEGCASILFRDAKRSAEAAENLKLTAKDKGYRDWETDRKSTRLNSSHSAKSRMPSSA